LVDGVLYAMPDDLPAPKASNCARPAGRRLRRARRRPGSTGKLGEPATWADLDRLIGKP